jgi:hypothetical protein
VELLKIRLRSFSMKEVTQADEEQIQRSAEALVRTHGDRASMVCAQTAERWRDRGDPEAAQLWNKFMLACRKLLDERSIQR